jgi:hypothetical protein
VPVELVIAPEAELDIAAAYVSAVMVLLNGMVVRNSVFG